MNSATHSLSTQSPNVSEDSNLGKLSSSFRLLSNTLPGANKGLKVKQITLSAINLKMKAGLKC